MDIAKPGDLIYWGAGLTLIGAMLTSAAGPAGLLIAVPAFAVLVVGLASKVVQIGRR